MKGIALAIVVAYLLSLVTMIVIAPYTLNLFPVKTQQIADDAVTTNKIAPYSIQHNSSWMQGPHLSKTTAVWEDIGGMSVVITLERTSNLIVLFSTNAAMDDTGYSISWQAVMRYENGTESILWPGQVYMQPGGLETSKYATLSYNWLQPNVAAGSYTVKVQWYVQGSTGWVYSRSLVVIALPA